MVVRPLPKYGTVRISPPRLAHEGDDMREVAPADGAVVAIRAVEGTLGCDEG